MDCDCYKERIKQLEFKLSNIETSKRDLLYQVELLKKENEKLFEMLDPISQFSIVMNEK